MAEAPGALIALVEDHTLLSAALAAALSAEGFRVVVPERTSLAAVGEELGAAAPHVALLDLDLGALGDGADLVAPLAAAGCRVVIVSGTTAEWEVGRCLELGAAGWVAKTASIDELLAAARDAAEGRPVLAEQTRSRLREAWRARKAERAATLAPFEQLSRREREVLAMLVDGRSAERIADASFVSVATVRTQIRSILAKLGVNSQLEATALVRRAGWALPGEG